MDTDKLLDTLRDLARRTVKAKFVEANPGYFLLGTVPREASDSEIGFVTGVHSIEAVRAKHDRWMKEGPATMIPGPFLAAVRKKKGNEWVRFVSVGRAPNNDVVLRHSTISKLHARVHIDKAGGPDSAEPEVYSLVDAGSAQGTSVNGRVLSTTSPVSIKPGDEIRFGALQCHFLDSPMLYDRLRRLPRKSSMDLPAVDVEPPPFPRR